MCILALAWRAHPAWQLVVAANRDEYHDRPAAPLARWPDGGIIAGQDLQAAGAWLGVSDAGRFAAITNRRSDTPPSPTAVSRGRLIGDLLSGDGDYANPATAPLDGFNPFNAISIAGDDGFMLANRPEAIRQPLAAGIHGLSNGPLDPPWPKTTRLLTAVERWLGDTCPTVERLLSALREPDRPAGGIGDTDGIFIADPRYGTRCSTVVIVDRTGQGLIAERRYDHEAGVTGETALDFAWH